MVSDLSDQENTFDDQETQLSILEAYVTNNTKPPVIRRNPRPGVHIYWRRRSFEYGSNDGNVDSSLAASILRCLSNNDETSLSAVHPTQLESNSTEDSAVRFSEVLSTLDCDDPASVAQHLFSILSSTNDNDQLQNELIDLFGLDQFDLVSKILSSRQAFLEDCRSCLNLLQLVSLDQTQAKKKKEPVCGQQITVHSSSDLHVRKLAKRQKKHLNKLIVKFNHQINEDGKSEWERLQNEIARNSDETVFTEQWVETSPRSQTPLPEDYPFVYNACHENNSHNYPFVYDACHGNDSQMFNFSGAELCLPNNCSRHNYGVYEEIHVPAVTAPQIKEMNQMNIDEFDDFAKKCFHGFEKLNVIQSVVFNQAYNSQENLLICAPTGAGKTNIALLSILNTLRKYLGDSKVCRNDFKIIYIAPMKALATEMTANFMNRLGKLNIRVRELTGDIKLSKKAIAETQMLVLTPEKWDVLTRKSMETPIMKLVKLLIIDEVHLLHDDRGPVIETIVARTLRQVEMSQEAIRIVGLSATLPNYVDVARFLRVNPSKGLFFFDSRFRPVPLSQTFIGVRNPPLDEANVMREMDEICYDKVHQFVKNKHQVLVFVTARNATSKLAHTFRDQASKKGHLKDFLPANLDSPSYKSSSKSVKSCRNGMIIELFQLGFGIHHAGVPRRERLLTEKLFARGHITVLFCTSTLAWGVNLPAHAVVIRGTEIFDIHRGIYCDMGVLDVQQIFGRAGRPQYETAGHGIVITWKRNLSKYLNMLLRQAPIESQFISRICDNLNAEVALGTVLSISEAVEWLKYTYFFIRAKLNPLAYGIPHSHLSRDPELSDFLTHVVTEAAKKLDMNEMIRFDEINGYVVSTDLGRIASNYYIRYETIEIFLNSSTEVKLQPIMTDDMILMLIASATEFSQVKLRDEEFAELQELANICPLRLKRGVLSTVCGKVNCLMQAHISRAGIRTYSLLSESQFVQGNSDRLCRAVFEIALKKGWAQAANGALVLAKCLDRQIWVFQTPLRQLDFIRMDWINKIERKNLRYYQLYEMSEKELGSMLNCDGRTIYQAVRMLPVLLVDAAIKPVTSTIIQVSVTVTPDFQWYDNFHGPMNGLVFWIFVEDIDENFILHHDQVLLSKKKIFNHESQSLVFTIPINDQQLTHRYQVRVASDRYVTDDSVVPISMHDCILPFSHSAHTELLDLDPLSLSALNNKAFESLYNFNFLNSIQTQVFFCLYQTDQNALIGAPTGSGKTFCAELAMFRTFNLFPDKKCVYIAPLKALVRERFCDWSQKFRSLNIRTVELTGDHTPDIQSLKLAQVIITTPEKWDGITRSWELRQYVKDVVLVIVDEIHLLGVERGSVLEAIITRLKLMTAKQRHINNIRVIGLSTALANAGDVAEWLNVSNEGLFNFPPNVRPVPIEVHISGFPGQYYCPRMALMDRPAYRAIKSYSPFKPVLVFVASRRQTRLTAMAFMSQLATEEDPKQWLNMDAEELEQLISIIKDDNLKLVLPFGIGLHHAGLQQYEKNIIEQLYVEKKIQVLVTTATLAWGINMPAHLVIIKGTEYYDGKSHTYVDFPVTDILQMIGRAGRPQFDNIAIAVIFVHDIKKNFYKRFLYEPFPVESSLLSSLPNHINAEIYAGTITSKQDVVQYIANTYFYRRILANPGYYCVENATPRALTQFLVKVVDRCLEELQLSKCIDIYEEDDNLISTSLGIIASLYYLDHKTVRFFASNITSSITIDGLVKVLADCPEYDEIPVRHNEDQVNAQLQNILSCDLSAGSAMNSPHTKAFLMLMAHFTHLELGTDFASDQHSMLDQCIRIINAMMDMSLLQKWLSTSLSVVILMQMIIQGTWHLNHPLLIIPHFTEGLIHKIGHYDSTIPLLKNKLGLDQRFVEKAKKQAIREILRTKSINEREAAEAVDALLKWPVLQPRNCILSSATETFQIDYLQDEVNADYIKVKSSARYTVLFTFESIGPYESETDAFCPRFDKERKAGWIAIIGEKDTGEVLCCKRILPIVGSKKIILSFQMPRQLGRHIFTMFVMSDSYIGIDQEYNLYCDIVEKTWNY